MNNKEDPSNVLQQALLQHRIFSIIKVKIFIALLHSDSYKWIGDDLSLRHWTPSGASPWKEEDSYKCLVLPLHAPQYDRHAYIRARNGAEQVMTPGELQPTWFSNSKQLE